MEEIERFYCNYFTIGDDDLKKELIYLDGFSELNKHSFNASTDASKAQNTYIIKKGTIWADLLFASSLNLVVSERFKNLFEGFTGVNFYPINILTKNLLALDVNYYNLIITGKCGAINNKLSKKVLATRIPGGPVFIKNLGIYFNPETWDKSDFFIPSETLFIIITKKVKEIIEENKLTNIRITPITEVENFVL